MSAHKKHLSKKGQISTIDIFIALSMFAVILIVFSITWNRYDNKISEEVSYSCMMVKAFQISDVIVKTPGLPGNWNENNVVTIGLASEEKVLSSEKVSSFINMSLNETLRIFSIPGYKYFFNLSDMDGNTLEEKGIQPSYSNKTVNIRRYVMYQDEPAVMEFTLWE